MADAPTGPEFTKTLKLRIKDKHAAFLGDLAREVNMVWNYVNEVNFKASNPFSGKPRYLTAYDLQKLITGVGKEGLVSFTSTWQQVCEEFIVRRRAVKKSKLRWRVSNPESPKRSLGWIPFKKGGVEYRAGQLKFNGRMLSLWDSYGLADYELRGGNFSQDSRGRWYLNVAVKVAGQASAGTHALGIDLGLKEAAVASDGQRIEGRFYQKLQASLGIAKRARKKGRARAIHAKIANQRKDMLHKFSTGLVQGNAAIFVGNVSATQMVKTTMAKAALDAGWSMLKTMLEYKSHQASIVFEEVNEAYTTQTCSCCGAIPASSPKGRAGLRIREWTCSDCGAEHDRDLNAAKNILAAGHCRLAGGIPTRRAGRMSTVAAPPRGAITAPSTPTPEVAP